MTQNFTVPMLDYIRYDETKNFVNLRDGLMKFFVGSIFINDLLDVCELIERDGRNQKPKLIEAYVTKIEAMVNEEFETAAEQKELIEGLKVDDRQQEKQS